MSFLSLRKCVRARVSICVIVCFAALGKQAGVGVTAWQGTCLYVEVFDGQWYYECCFQGN